MGKHLYENGASSLLAVGINNVVTTVSVTATEGALFPAISGTDYFYVTVEDSGGNMEIMRVTARAGDNLTVVRGQQATTAQAFSSGARVENRITADFLERLLQRDLATGNYNAGSDEIIVQELRGAEGGPILALPSNGDPPTFDGDEILRDTSPGVVPVGGIILWSGSIGTIPANWQLCDGTNGTPDLRSKFVIGAGDAYVVAATGGSLTPTAASNGAHTHGAATGSTTLTTAQIPLHGHPFFLSVEDDSASDPTGGLVMNNDSSSVKSAFTGTPAAAAGQQIGGAGGGTGHTHTISSDGAHTHTVDLPAYYALAYIRRMA